MNALESALKTIDRERLRDHGNYTPPVYVFRTINELTDADPFEYGYALFLLGMAKGRRMEKAARKGGAQNG